jgi:cytochrome P450
VDFDMFTVQPVNGDIHGGWVAQLQGGPELVYTPRNGGHWIATRGEAIYEILHDWQHFSTESISLTTRGMDRLRFIPSEMDPPVHTLYRAVLNPELSPGRIKAFEEKSRALARQVIERIQPNGHCDFPAEVGRILPIYNFLQFVDMPISDAKLLVGHVEKVSSGTSFEAFEEGLSGLAGYLAEKIEECRGRDSILGRIINADIGDRKITTEEAILMIRLLLLGGLDTTTQSMAFYMNFLAHNPEHRAQLIADPDAIPEAVEELLRRFAIFNTGGRLVKEDIVFRGMHLRERDLIMAPAQLYNLDPLIFPDPLTVDFKRSDKRHLTFGSGVHRCAGSSFARIQLVILLQEWLAHIPDFSVAQGTETQFGTGRVNSVTQLRLEW